MKASHRLPTHRRGSHWEMFSIIPYYFRIEFFGQTSLCFAMKQRVKQDCDFHFGLTLSFMNSVLCRFLRYDLG